MATGDRWTHADTRGLGKAVQVAILRALDPKNGWAKGPIEDRIADFRALLFVSMWMFDELSMEPATIDETIPGPESKLSPVVVTPRDTPQFSSAERARIARIGTQTTWFLLYQRWDIVSSTGASPKVFASIATMNGQPAEPIVMKGEAGAAWLLPALGMVLGAVTVCFIVQRGSEIIDRQLARMADAQGMMSTQAKVLDVLAAHKAAERTAGKEIPLTDAELKVIAALETIQAKFGERNKPGGAFPTFVPSGSETMETVKTVGLGILGVVVLLFLASQLLPKRS